MASANRMMPGHRTGDAVRCSCALECVMIAGFAGRPARIGEALRADLVDHLDVVMDPDHLAQIIEEDKALIAVIPEAYIHAVSTRSVDDLAKAMGNAGISKSHVSRLCEEIDERVKTFLSRPIDGAWPYVWIDATYVKVREGGRIISVAVIIAVGANADGRREVLGMAVASSEAEPFWTQFLRSLTARGLRGVKLVISDSHEGLKKAVRKVFGATWQRCSVHFMRNALANVNVKRRSMVAAAIRTAFAQKTEKEARSEWDAVFDRLRERAPR
jgi:putative transposase